MASRPEVLGNRTIGREEALGVTRWLKPLHAALPLTGRLVGILRAVIEVPVLAVFHPRQNLLLCGTIAFELVRNDHPGDILAALEQLAEELLGRVLVPSALDQDIQHLPILIHRPPEIVAGAPAGAVELIPVPFVPWSLAPAGH